MADFIKDLFLGLSYSSIGIVTALPVVWANFSGAANMTLAPFSSVNTIVTLGLLLTYTSAFGQYSLRDFFVCVLIAFLFHVGRLSVYLENEDKRFRVLFLSLGYTKKEYVVLYLLKRSIKRNIASLLTCWGLFSTVFVVNRVSSGHELSKLLIGTLLVILGFTSASLDRKE
ncbi:MULTISPECIES: hypothetical protein [Pseudothermotoga]|uniref:Uncharacterized protein n=1 Tax=Pseudothermotoga lettingae (strain ATCC BAA-301 / DSM 14385 / NBRC 107922 / TMO) TaxID=416591 RepID=A8F7M3_PSELT|nr:MULTISPECIES: hypothetical protein [Pseudothermotoga]ABV34157.1 hypothetical protein Tlet_1603 [Pseudothermotoga lettingae TMO]KUK21488.1 MAG: Uncharacterized protein XD56_0576 [Pseudothermotoga lettingae]MDI3495164.1 hypothetical protein [Pseudothermotoga sp.]MDK2884763.1 hypothetical protein [Pseudothermotoga sp.]GLI48899.1 hypothetical protein PLETTINGATMO_10680 [Pseudothermotoga lettingae TMO]